MELVIENCTKVINKKTVLEHINMRCSSGKIYGVMGENGSGKTMLLKAISGLIKVDKGHIWIDDKEIRKDIDNPESIGVLIESPTFIEKYTGYKNLRLLASLDAKIKEKDICDVLQKVGLEKGDSRNYAKYSLGMKQRLGIACAFMGSPQLILLDEPFNALDEDSAKRIRKMIIDAKNKGSLIILACHDHEEVVSLSDEIYYMKAGKITNHEIIGLG